MRICTRAKHMWQKHTHMLLMRICTRTKHMWQKHTHMLLMRICTRTKHMWQKHTHVIDEDLYICDKNTHICYWWGFVPELNICDKNTHICYWWGFVLELNICDKNTHICYWWGLIHMWQKHTHMLLMRTCTRTEKLNPIWRECFFCLQFWEGIFKIFSNREMTEEFDQRMSPCVSNKSFINKAYMEIVLSSLLFPERLRTCCSILHQRCNAVTF